MRRFFNIKTEDLAFLLVVFFLLGFIVGSSLFPRTVSVNDIRYTTQELQINERSTSLLVPAVDQQGIGVAGTLETRVRPGSGVISFDITNVLNEFDTQNSGRIAARVAQDYTKINTTNIDITFFISVDATVIGGPSAGAAMAVSIVAALQNKTLNKNVMITGTINEDGTIGQVGEIVAKASTANENNITVFLVPPGQSTQYEYKKNERCEIISGFQYCRINYIPQEVNIGELFGIEVIEVANIEEALNYFLSE